MAVKKAAKKSPAKKTAAKKLAPKAQTLGQPVPAKKAPAKKAAPKPKKAAKAAEVELPAEPLHAPVEAEDEFEISNPAALEAEVASELDAQVSSVPEEALPVDLSLEADPTPEDVTEELLEEEEDDEEDYDDEDEEEEEEDEEEDEEDAIAAPTADTAPRNEERLQKILAHAGIASRRHAEELIAEGHVQVNGQTITTPGFKADPARDHIRVDGKLLHGAERLRYFLLNKPRGFVTTVSDPEGRPTVMQFFAKLGERLYPVGRLDYQSEGLLLVTNDGPLSNQLTRAASGVEKTYLVKVSGQPSEEALARLRSGVAIPKSRPGEGKVQTSPARIRLVRAGENPWYEVVLIEGRNRELRKMFGGEGHNVEKIRRVAYGPLVLDIPAGETRELRTEEVDLLRLAAEGKYRSRKIDFSVLLPKEAGRTVDHEAAKERGKRPYGKNFRYQDRDQRPGVRGPRREQGQGAREQRSGDRGRDFGGRREDRPAFGRGRPDARSGERFGERPARPAFSKDRPERSGERPGKPAFSKDRPERGGERFGRPAFGQGRPERRGERPGKPEFSKGFGGKRFDQRPTQRPFDRRPSFEISEEPSGEFRPKANFDRTARFSQPPRRDEGEAPRERFGRGHDQYQDRHHGQRQDRRPERYQDRYQGRNQEQESGGFEERRQNQRPDQRGDQRTGQPFRPGGRPGGASGGFGKSREAGGGRKFGGKPASGGGFKSGGKPGFKSGPKSGFKSGPRSGFKSGSRPGGQRPNTSRGRGRDI
jgi:23S rRNA pseudouridine2605 synthase